MSKREPAYRVDPSTAKFVAMITQTNLVALDKTIAQVKGRGSYAERASRVAAIADRMERALREISYHL